MLAGQSLFEVSWVMSEKDEGVGGACNVDLAHYTPHCTAVHCEILPYACPIGLL